MSTAEKSADELTPAQKAKETYKRNRELRQTWAKEEAERHHADRERVAGLVPYDARKVMEAEPPDIKAFAKAVQTLEALSQQGGKE